MTPTTSTKIEWVKPIWSGSPSASLWSYSCSLPRHQLFGYFLTPSDASVSASESYSS